MPMILALCLNLGRGYMPKKQDAALGYLIVIGLIVGAVVKFFEEVGYLIPVVGLVGAVAFFYIYKSTQKEKRILDAKVQ